MTINDYVEEVYYKNTLMLSYNPLQTIALASEILQKVGSNRRKFENECRKIKDKLLHLGKIYSAKIEDEKFYEKLILGEDFKGRTVLKIITQNGFEPLMDEHDPKAENLMLTIWKGKESTKCDGNILGYSNLVHNLATSVKKGGTSGGFFAVTTNFFEPNFKVDYQIQYRYRSKDISFYFSKEFVCALAMLILF